MWKVGLFVATAIWLSVTGVFAVGYYQTDMLNQELRVQIMLLQDVRSSETELRLVETRRCAEIYKVNTVCEKVVVAFATQLGIDTVSPSQILTAGIVERQRAGGMGGGE
jgi:hypothetical protein